MEIESIFDAGKQQFSDDLETRNNSLYCRLVYSDRKKFEKFCSKPKILIIYRNKRKTLKINLENIALKINLNDFQKQNRVFQ